MTRTRKVPSASDLVRRVVDARLASLLTNTGDVIGDNGPSHMPGTWADLEAAVRRDRGYDATIDVTDDVAYMLGVEMGRRIGGAR